MKVTKDLLDTHDKILTEIEGSIKNKSMVIIFALDSKENKTLSFLCSVSKNSAGKLYVKPMAQLFDYDPLLRHEPVSSDDGSILLVSVQEGCPFLSEVEVLKSDEDKKLLN